MADNLCFCGFASVQLMSPDQSLRKDDIKHLTFENEARANIHRFLSCYVCGFF